MVDIPDLLPAVLLDAGAREWRCGFSDDDGPGELLPAPPPSGGFAAWREQLGKALTALEATPGTEHAVLMSERPGTSAAAREAMARAVFEDHDAGALWFVAAPLLALFNSGHDTGLLVDVGERCTYILAVFEGRPVLDAAAAHPLAGGHVPNSAAADAEIGVLFDPSLSGATAGDAAAVAAEVDAAAAPVDGGAAA